MPIDKNQNSGGVRWMADDGPQICVGCAPSLRTVEARPDFLGWTLEWRPSWRSDVMVCRRTDYEVDSEGRLIRLGDQIEEELYPATGLMFVADDGRSYPMTPNGMTGEHRTVAEVERLNHFSHWADTPRNRELGLFKEEVPLNVKPCMDVTAFVGNADTSAFPQMTVDGDVIKRCPDCDAIHTGREPTPPFPGLKVTSLRCEACGCQLFVIMDQSFSESVGMCEGDAWCPNCSPKPKEKEVSMSEKKFEVGDRVRCVEGTTFGQAAFEGLATVTNPATRQMAHMVAETPRVLVRRDDGQTGGGPDGEWVMRAEYLELVTEETDTFVNGEQVDDVRLTPEQHRKMVETQNKSLAATETFEETSWIKAKLPDGRIVESPMPSVKDGWEEVWSDRWQEEDGVMVSGDRGYSLVLWTGAATKFTVYEPIAFNDPGGCCWLHDMRMVLISSDRVGPGLVGSPLALAAKRFRREIVRRKPEDTTYMIDNCDYFNDQWGSYKDHLLRDPNPDWPDRHPVGPLKPEK